MLSKECGLVGGDMVANGTWELASEEYCGPLMRRLSRAVATSNGLPGSSGHEYLTSVSGKYRMLVKKLEGHLLGTLSDLTKGTWEENDVEEVFNAVVGATDDALESAHTKIEEATAPKSDLAARFSERTCPWSLPMRKPQLDFEDFPIDNSDTPFTARSERANNAIPEEIRRHMNELLVNNEQVPLPHPYEAEIRAALEKSLRMPGK